MVIAVIAGEFAIFSANSPTIIAKIRGALRGRFVKRPYDRIHNFRLFSQPHYYLKLFVELIADILFEAQLRLGLFADTNQ